LLAGVDDSDDGLLLLFLRLIRRLAPSSSRLDARRKDRQRPKNAAATHPSGASGIVVLLCYVRGLGSLFGLGSPFIFCLLAATAVDAAKTRRQAVERVSYVPLANCSWQPVIISHVADFAIGQPGRRPSLRFAKNLPKGTVHGSFILCAIFFGHPAVSSSSNQ
jgi:hypothetical protein